jgi:endonuclease I
MKTRQFLAAVTLCLATAVAQAQGPNNSGTYYQNADGKKGAALKTALYNIIKTHTTISYSGLDEYYRKTDRREADPSKNEVNRTDGYLRDWYSNATSYTFDTHGTNTEEGKGWNKEHSVPQSWFGKGSPMKSDIVHVLPTDCYVNNRRGNYPLAEVGSVSWASKNNYSKLGSCKTAGYSGTVFEPNDEIKGDMARIYFYMVTCYEDKATGWGHSVFSSSKYPGFEQWYLDMLMRWSKQDPIDQREIDRNNAVARSDVQGNRNPFVDYPGLEDYVWGSKKEEAFSYDNYAGGSTIDPDILFVAQPVFSPDGGTFTDQVVVTMSTTTEGATIYYTTDKTNASEQSLVYESPITLSETTTLKAIAVKDGTTSYQTTATYVITTGGSGGEEPVEGLIALNNSFFGTSYSGSIDKNNKEDLSGTQNGITVIYSLGEGGANRFCNNEQIRLYQKNQLTISVDAGELSQLEFQLAKETSKSLIASSGSVNGMTWTGSANSVTFNVNDGSGNMQLSGVKVKLTSTDIHTLIEKNVSPSEQGIIYSLSGQKVDRHTMKSGLYLSNGKKFVIR